MLALILLACRAPSDSDPPVDTDVIPSRYADPASFLCHPGLDDDLCDGPIEATEVEADGTSTVTAREPAVDPGVDCFYVYPTASGDSTPNADFEAGDGERFMVATQAAHYAQVCEVYAPVHRQVTLAGLFVPGADFELAYGDVREAFDATIGASDRPFLLIGHSQGTSHLTRLIAEQIEGDPALQGRFVAAHLLGGFVTVPSGARVGGSFASTPICASADEVGCVVHYVTFAEDDPPGPSAFFGRADPGSEVACVSPAGLLGQASPRGVFPASVPLGAAVLAGLIRGPYADPAANEAVSTGFFAVPGLLGASCRAESGASWLEITVDADPSDPRVDEVSGRAPLLVGWGLHLVDVAVQADDLVELAARQIAAHGG